MPLRYPQMGIEFFGWRDGGYGPLDLTPKRSEILIILETPFMYVRLDQTSANLPNGAASLDKPPGPMAIRPPRR